MKKVMSIILMSIGAIVFAQQQKETETIQKTKILKVSYNAYPISTYDTPPTDSEGFKKQAEIVALAQSYEHKYSLYINLDTNESIYCLDTLIVNKKSGQENLNYMINNNLEYVFKNKFGKVFKFEKIFERKFYSDGDLNNIEWILTDEFKTISGYKCQKAIAKNEGLLLNVWFTDEIAVAAGPVNYFGLPGLVIWSEDFFWTTEIENITYADATHFETLKTQVLENFDKNKKGSEIKESLLIVKKCGLVKSMIDQMRN